MSNLADHGSFPALPDVRAAQAGVDGVIAPSDILQPQTYIDIDPETIARYLIANRWTCIHEEDGRFLGLRWFRHPAAPRWRERELVTNRAISTAFPHLIGTDQIDALVGGGTIVRVGAKRHREYPQMNRHVLLDLEAHEDRWIGFIIADVRRFEAGLRGAVAA